MSEWKCIKEEKPPIGRNVLIWRSHRNHRKYAVGKLENEYGLDIWRSTSGNVLKIEENDRWFEFPLLSITETYI